MRLLPVLFFGAAVFCIYKFYERNAWKTADTAKLSAAKNETRVEYSSNFSNSIDSVLPLYYEDPTNFPF